MGQTTSASGTSSTPSEGGGYSGYSSNEEQKNKIRSSTLMLWRGSWKGGKWKTRTFQLNGAVLSFSKKNNTAEEYLVLKRCTVYEGKDPDFTKRLEQLGLPSRLKNTSNCFVVAEGPGLWYLALQPPENLPKDERDRLASEWVDALRKAIHMANKALDESRDEKQETLSSSVREGDLVGKTKLQALELLIDGDIAAVSNPRLKRLTNSLTTKVFDQSDLHREQTQVVMEVAERLRLTIAEATASLRHFSWNRNRLMNAWHQDEASVRNEAGLAVAEFKKELGSDSAVDPNAEVLCPICFDNVKVKETTALSCGHKFCGTCWKGFCEEKVKSGNSCVSAICMYHKCTAKVPRGTFEKFLSEDAEGRALLRKYDEYSNSDYVDKNKALIWCPAAGCGRALEIPKEGDSNLDLHCACGFSFCQFCKKEAHGPLPCSLVQQWDELVIDSDRLSEKEKKAKERTRKLKEKMRKNAEKNEKWLLKRAKPCPQCLRWIEKNQGCNHMTCRQNAGGCGHQFCWLCLGNWQGHRNCNSSNAAAKQREVLERKRKEGYWDSVKIKIFGSKEEERLAFASKKFLEAKSSIEHLKKNRSALEVVVAQSAPKFTRADREFLYAAINRVVLCRRTLAWSYALSHFLPGDTPPAQLLDRQQAILERYTEALHEIVEAPLKVLNYLAGPTAGNFHRFQSRILQAKLKAAAAEKALVTAGVDFHENGLLPSGNKPIYGQDNAVVTGEDVKTTTTIAAAEAENRWQLNSAWWTPIDPHNRDEGGADMKDEKEALEEEDYDEEHLPSTLPGMLRQRSKVEPVVSYNNDGVEGYGYEGKLKQHHSGKEEKDVKEEEEGRGGGGELLAPFPTALPSLKRQPSAMWACVLCAHLNPLSVSECERCKCAKNDFTLRDFQCVNMHTKCRMMIDRLEKYDREAEIYRTIVDKGRAQRTPMILLHSESSPPKIIAYQEVLNEERELEENKISSQQYSFLGGRSKKKKQTMPQFEKLGEWTQTHPTVGKYIRGPAGIEYDALYDRLLIVMSGLNRVLVVSLQTGEIIDMLGFKEEKKGDNKVWKRRADGKGNLRTPYYCCAFENRIYVTSYIDNRVVVYNRNTLEFMRNSPNVTHPMGICADNAHIYVAAAGENRVVVFDRHTLCKVKTLGSGAGARNNNLQLPYDIACDERNLYICDRNNNRLIIWDKNDGKYVRQWRYVPNQGSASMRSVCGVALCGGNVFVQEYTGKGTFMFSESSPIGEILPARQTCLGITVFRKRLRSNIFAAATAEVSLSREQGAPVLPKKGFTWIADNTVRVWWDTGSQHLDVQSVSLSLLPKRSTAFTAHAIRNNVKEMVIAERIPNTGSIFWRLPKDKDFSKLFICNNENQTTLGEFQIAVKYHANDPKEQKLIKILTSLYMVKSSANLAQILAALIKLELTEAQAATRVAPALFALRTKSPSIFADNDAVKKLLLRFLKPYKKKFYDHEREMQRRLQKKGNGFGTGVDEEAPNKSIMRCIMTSPSLVELKGVQPAKEILDATVFSCDGICIQASRHSRNVLYRSQDTIFSVMRHRRRMKRTARGEHLKDSAIKAVDLTLKMPKMMRVSSVEIGLPDWDDASTTPVGALAVFVSVHPPPPNAFKEWDNYNAAQGERDFNTYAKKMRQRGRLNVMGTKFSYDGLCSKFKDRYSSLMMAAAAAEAKEGKGAQIEIQNRINAKCYKIIKRCLSTSFRSPQSFFIVALANKPGVHIYNVGQIASGTNAANAQPKKLLHLNEMRVRGIAVQSKRRLVYVIAEKRLKVYKLPARGEEEAEILNSIPIGHHVKAGGKRFCKLAVSYQYVFMAHPGGVWVLSPLLEKVYSKIKLPTSPRGITTDGQYLYICLKNTIHLHDATMIKKEESFAKIGTIDVSNLMHIAVSPASSSEGKSNSNFLYVVAKYKSSAIFTRFHIKVLRENNTTTTQQKKEISISKRTQLSVAAGAIINPDKITGLYVIRQEDDSDDNENDSEDTVGDEGWRHTDALVVQTGTTFSVFNKCCGCSSTTKKKEENEKKRGILEYKLNQLVEPPYSNSNHILKKSAAKTKKNIKCGFMYWGPSIYPGNRKEKPENHEDIAFENAIGDILGSDGGGGGGERTSRARMINNHMFIAEMGRNRLQVRDMGSTNNSAIAQLNRVTFAPSVPIQAIPNRTLNMSSITSVEADDQFVYINDYRNHCILIVNRDDFGGSVARRVNTAPMNVVHILGIRGRLQGRNTNNGFSSPCLIHLDEHYIYVSDYGNCRLQIFNRETREYVATIDHRRFYSFGCCTDDNHVYIAIQSAPQQVRVFTKNTWAAERTIHVAPCTPYGIAVDEQYIYLSGYNRNDLVIHDKYSGRMVRTIGGTGLPGWNRPFNIKLYENTLYVSMGGGGIVKCINIASGVERDITGVSSPRGIAFARNFSDTAGTERRRLKATDISHFRVRDEANPVAFVDLSKYSLQEYPLISGKSSTKSSSTSSFPSDSTTVRVPVPPYFAACGRYVTFKLLRPKSITERADELRVSLRETMAMAKQESGESDSSLPPRFDPSFISSRGTQIYDFSNNNRTARKARVGGTIYIIRSHRIPHRKIIRIRFRVDRYVSGDFQVGFMTRRETRSAWLRNQENNGIYGITNQQYTMRAGVVITFTVRPLLREATASVGNQTIRTWNQINIHGAQAIFAAVAMRQIGNQVTLLGGGFNDGTNEEKGNNNNNNNNGVVSSMFGFLKRAIVGSSSIKEEKEEKGAAAEKGKYGDDDVFTAAQVSRKYSSNSDNNNNEAPSMGVSFLGIRGCELSRIDSISSTTTTAAAADNDQDNKKEKGKYDKGEEVQSDEKRGANNDDNRGEEAKMMKSYIGPSVVKKVNGGSVMIDLKEKIPQNVTKCANDKVEKAKKQESLIASSRDMERQLSDYHYFHNKCGMDMLATAKEYYEEGSKPKIIDRLFAVAHVLFRAGKYRKKETVGWKNAAADFMTEDIISYIHLLSSYLNEEEEDNDKRKKKKEEEEEDTVDGDDVKSMHKKERKEALTVSPLKVKHSALSPSRCRCVFGLWAMLCENPKRKGRYLPEIQCLLVTIGKAGEFIRNALTLSGNAPGVRFAALEALCALASSNQETSPILATLLVPHVIKCLRSTQDQTIAYEGLRALHALLEAWPQIIYMMEKNVEKKKGFEKSAADKEGEEEGWTPSELSSVTDSLNARFSFDVDVVSLCMRMRAVIQAITAAEVVDENTDASTQIIFE